MVKNRLLMPLTLGILGLTLAGCGGTKVITGSSNFTVIVTDYPNLEVQDVNPSGQVAATRLGTIGVFDSSGNPLFVSNTDQPTFLLNGLRLGYFEVEDPTISNKFIPINQAIFESASSRIIIPLEKNEEGLAIAADGSILLRRLDPLGFPTGSLYILKNRTYTALETPFQFQSLISFTTNNILVKDTQGRTWLKRGDNPWTDLRTDAQSVSPNGVATGKAGTGSYPQAEMPDRRLTTYPAPSGSQTSLLTNYFAADLSLGVGQRNVAGRSEPQTLPYQWKDGQPQAILDNTLRPGLQIKSFKVPQGDPTKLILVYEETDINGNKTTGSFVITAIQNSTT